VSVKGGLPRGRTGGRVRGYPLSQERAVVAKGSGCECRGTETNRPNKETTNQIRGLEKHEARIRGRLFRQNPRVRCAYPGYFAGFRRALGSGVRAR